jgi:hypothetical protein
MVDPKVLKINGCTEERLREIFTSKGSADIPACPEDASDEEKAKHAKCVERADCNLEIRRRIENRIWCRILQGITVNCRNARPYQAVDMAMDAPPITKESVPLLLWAQGKIKLESLVNCLSRDCGEEQAKKFVQKTDQGTLKLNIPRITETPVNIVRSYVTRRLAAMDALWSNLWPLLKYEPRGKDPVSQLRADALTQRIDIMADSYGYRHMGTQWRRDMLMYTRCTAFPRQSWERKIQWEFEPTNTGVQSDKVQSYVEREGLDMINSHPSRTYYDLNSPLAAINTDTGPSWIGYWDIVRFGTLVDSKDTPYYNTGSLWITDEWTGIFSQYSDFFGFYFDPCVLKWPEIRSGMDPTQRNSRTANIGLYNWAPLTGGKGLNNENTNDCGVLISQHFERINPKSEGIGDYDADVWVRFAVGGAGTVMYAEFMPSLPAVYGGINVNDARLDNQSMAMELLSYQDQLTNIVTTMIEQLRSSFVQLWLLDKDVLDEKTLQMFEKNAANREWWMDPHLVQYSSSKLKEMFGTGNTPQEAFKIIQANVSNTVQGALSAMGQLLNLADRLLILSPNELGQPNPREVSARESQEISTSVQSIYSFINEGPREMNAAFKELLYESLICCGTDKFTVPTVRRYTKETIEKAGFKLLNEDSAKGDTVPASTLVVGSLKDLRYDYTFDSRDGVDRAATSQTIQGMVQLLQVLTQTLGPELGKDRIYEIANGIIRASGLPIDMVLEMQDGESASIPPQQQAQPGQGTAPEAQQQGGGLPPQLQAMLQQQDRRIQQLEQLLQRVAGGGQATGQQVPQPPVQAAPAQPPASRMSMS